MENPNLRKARDILERFEKQELLLKPEMWAEFLDAYRYLDSLIETDPASATLASNLKKSHLRSTLVQIDAFLDLNPTSDQCLGYALLTMVLSAQQELKDLFAEDPALKASYDRLFSDKFTELGITDGIKILTGIAEKRGGKQQ